MHGMREACPRLCMTVSHTCIWHPSRPYVSHPYITDGNSVAQEGFKAECSRQVQKLIWVANRSSYSHTYSARAGAHTSCWAVFMI